MTNVIVYSLEAEHDLGVYNSFLKGYSSNGARYSGNLDIIPFGNLDSALSFASTNNYQFIIYSVANTEGLTGTANNYYPNVLTFLPAGSNSHIEIFHQSITSNNISSVITGTTTGNNQNITGYNVEFIDIDPIYNAHSSNSVAYIAGKIAYIKDWYKCSDWEARYIARRTASLKDNFTNVNGFGIINLHDAINTCIQIPEDPLIELGAIGNITVERIENTVNIAIDEVINATNYKIYRNNIQIYNGSNTSYSELIEPNGIYEYKYCAYNIKSTTAFSNTAKIVYNRYTSIYYK